MQISANLVHFFISHAVAFTENPHPLGLPSLHDPSRHWDPFFAACEETETIVCMHIGSSSSMPTTSPDAPFIVETFCMGDHGIVSGYRGAHSPQDI